MKTISTTHREMIFVYELNKIVGFIKRKYPAGTHLRKKPTALTNIHEEHLMCFWVDISHIIENFYCVSALVPHLLLKFSKSLHHFCLKK